MQTKINLLGFLVTITLYILYCLMFILRLIGEPQLGHGVATLQFLSVIPLVYLLIKAPQFDRHLIFYLQIVLFLVFLAVEFILDYLLKYDFRHTRWMVISYVTFFFAATGGLLGLAAAAKNRIYIVVSVVLFLVMGVLAFVSRAVTGI